MISVAKFLSHRAKNEKVMTKTSSQLNAPLLLTWSAICVFTVTPSKIKMQTSRYRKSLIWEMKEDEDKPRQGSGLCDNSYARYSEKRFTQIYKALCVDAMLVSLWGAQICGLPQTNRNICFWVFLLMRKFRKELIKIKVIFILRQRLFRWQNLKKSVTFLTHIRADRLRVVPHFSSGIVERAKRERAWKSPHARKGSLYYPWGKMGDYS